MFWWIIDGDIRNGCKGVVGAIRIRPIITANAILYYIISSKRKLRKVSFSFNNRWIPLNRGKKSQKHTADWIEF